MSRFLFRLQDKTHPQHHHELSPILSPEIVPDRFVSGWSNRDADEIASVFSENAEFVNVTGILWHDKSDIRKAHDYGLRVIFNDSFLKLQKSSVKHLTERVAVIHTKTLLTRQIPHAEAQKPQARHNIFTLVAKQFKDANWLFVSAHNTDIVPGAETNIIDGSGSLRSANFRTS